MAQGFWRLYKAKVLQTLAGPRPDGALQDEVGWGGVPKMGCPTPLPPPALTAAFLQGEPPELMETAEPPALMEEGGSPVSQLARKVRRGLGQRGGGR